MPAPTALRRPLATAAALAAALTLGSAGAATADAQTLAGEAFAPAVHSEALFYGGTCVSDGPSTFTFRANGPATGPIPGQSETYGTLTLASPSGPVTAFSADFTIFTADDMVTGTAGLAESVAATCSPGSSGANLAVDVRATYDVTYPFDEQGPVRFTLGGENGVAETYSASFGAEIPAPPTRPTTKADCMNGGWADFGFKNQGDCVSWVVSNRP